MKILVTGSDGYIGTVLVQELLKEGFKVVGLDTGYYRSGWLFNGEQALPKTISKDIRLVAAKDLVGFDAVVHLAELSNDPIGENNPEITYKINHEGTVKLANNAKEAGVKRFVYFSSCSVYGASDEIRDEESPTNPLTAYAKCKVLNERELLKLGDENFSPIILRNATVFGVSPRMRFDLSVNNLAGFAWTTHEIKLESDGTPWRPFVHIKDVCQAVIYSLKAPLDTIHNQIFNVGNTNSNYQIKEVAESISKIFPGCKISYGENGEDKRNYRVSFNKINSKLPGFKCKKTLENGIRELFDTFKKIGMDKNVFESRNYTRLKQIKHLRQTNQINEEFFWT